MVVVTNRIPVTTGHEIDFEDRFRNRVYLVDKSPRLSRTIRDGHYGAYDLVNTWSRAEIGP